MKPMRGSLCDQVFLLSPAYCGGRRAQILRRPGSGSSLAIRLREGTLTLGEAFAFMSGLYFRGKLAYARTFGRAPAGTAGSTLIITPTRGLQLPEQIVTEAAVNEFATVDVSASDDRYTRPLERDASALAAALDADARVVLLGSIATGKYVDLLASILGPRLHYPSAFVGRGDMSRGGLLLRSAAASTELEYDVLSPGIRPRGPRPPRLDPRLRVPPSVIRRMNREPTRP
ncbi:MAG: hypothetical protein AB7F99_07700 [Vicinamibacterales bacterium]